MSSGWQPALACSVIGAAHRRRGLPCQDAVAAWSLQDAEGAPLQLMVVSDGHGHRRHWLSQIGSELACEQSRLAVAAALAHQPLRDPQGWLTLLQHELPASIVQGWLRATAADWQERPEAGDEPFSAATYGCTLGLVLMAPGWWAHTGVGDWDLVAIAADGTGRLMSEEPPNNAGAEATASLCPKNAPALFHLRAGLERRPPRALVLSTDGVRKSCTSDADFLLLCRELSSITDREPLRQGLEQITSQGSGDDVSVAIGRLEGGSPPGAWRRLSLTLGVTTAVAGGIALAALRWPQPRQPQITSAVQLEARRVCAAPQRIRATLNQRRPQFQQVLSGGGPALLAAASRDPLGALIAGSRPAAALPLQVELCGPLREELKRQWQQLRAATAGRDAAPASGKMPAVSPRP